MTLRNFINLLEQNSELARIKDEVNCKYEIGERTRQAQRSDIKQPALLFENIKDYPGHSILTNGFGSHSRIALALGLAPATVFKEIVKVFRQRTSNSIKPVMVRESPFKENILKGEDVNLTKLPVPWWSRKDGGKYIGTWHLNITSDPETGIRNVGIYRMQLLSPRTTAISFSPRSHLAVHLSNAENKGNPLEMAVAIGVDELLIMAAAAAFPYGRDEFYISGALKQAPVELIKCQTIDLKIPASAEIVLEGKIYPDKRIKEGPFLDYSGTPNLNPAAFVFEVSCMMYRNNPIFRGTSVGIAGAEDHILLSLLSCAGYLDFHGSRIRQKIQNLLLRNDLFRAFQYLGAIGNYIKKKQ